MCTLPYDDLESVDFHYYNCTKFLKTFHEIVYHRWAVLSERENLYEKLHA